MTKRTKQTFLEGVGVRVRPSVASLLSHLHRSEKRLHVSDRFQKLERLTDATLPAQILNLLKVLEHALSNLWVSSAHHLYLLLDLLSEITADPLSPAGDLL